MRGLSVIFAFCWVKNATQTFKTNFSHYEHVENSLRPIPPIDKNSIDKNSKDSGRIVFLRIPYDKSGKLIKCQNLTYISINFLQ